MSPSGHVGRAGCGLALPARVPSPDGADPVSCRGFSQACPLHLKPLWDFRACAGFRRPAWCLALLGGDKAAWAILEFCSPRLSALPRLQTSQRQGWEGEHGKRRLVAQRRAPPGLRGSPGAALVVCLHRGILRTWPRL